MNQIYKINFDRIDSKEFLENYLKEFNSYKNITTYLNSEVTDVKGSIGDFKVKVKKRARSIHMDLCTGCGACVENCPVVQLPASC